MTTTRRSTTAVLAIILVSCTMMGLDTSIVITGPPEIQRGLGFSATGLSWVQNAYTLAFGGLLLLGARAGDIPGRRRTFVAGLGLFTLALLQTHFAEGPERTRAVGEQARMRALLHSGGDVGSFVLGFEAMR